MEKFLFSDTVSPFAKIATAKSEFIGRADAGKMSGKEEKICDFGEESFSCSKNIESDEFTFPAGRIFRSRRSSLALFPGKMPLHEHNDIYELVFVRDGQGFQQQEEKSTARLYELQNHDLQYYV